MLEPTHVGSLALALLAVVSIAGCGEKNPPELNEAAQKAADQYCDCVKSALANPVDQLKGACAAEEKAYKEAWAALPVAGRDPKAEPIFTYQHECFRLLSDARMKMPAD